MSDLDQFLDSLARDAKPGDRLPTIREVMRRFGASQVLVQRAFQRLKDRGLISSEVGRGTYFLSEGGAAGTEAAPASVMHSRPPKVKSVLLLRRSISIARGRVLAEGLQLRFAADGHRVLEVSYTDPEHARAVLKSLPRFDACVIQSSFKTITIDLLSALKDKSDVVAVDGAALVGADVEAVGMEWGEPLTMAVNLLRAQGHRRIAYASSSHPSLAIQLGRRRFEYLQSTLQDVDLRAITVPHLPDANYEASLVSMVESSFDAAGRPPFTALVAWGIEDGAKFQKLMQGVGLSIPSALSVVLLGRTDIANEHAGYFNTVGCSVADQIGYLYQAIQARWEDPGLPYGITLIPVTSIPGQSVAAPRSGG